MVLAIKAGTVGQIRPDTHEGSVHQPVHVKDLRIHIGPLQDGLDGDLVQAVLGCILPNLQPICMHFQYYRRPCTWSQSAWSTHF